MSSHRLRVLASHGPHCLTDHAPSLRRLPCALAQLACAACAVAACGRPPRNGATPQDAPAVACSLGRPAAAPGDTLRVAAAVIGTPEAGLQWTWSVSRGRILGQGARVRWLLDGGDVGVDSARVQVARRGRALGGCVARVAVEDGAPMRGPEDLAARRLLAPGEREAVGYGAYAYLLLGGRPAEGEAEARTRAALDALFRALVPAARLEALLVGADTARRGEMSVAYIPVAGTPRWRAAADTATALLAAYDYPRAALLLAHVPGGHPDGPYLVATAAPLGARAAGADSALVYDLGDVPPRLVPLWIEAFVGEATQHRFRERWSARRTMLTLRVLLARAGEGLPLVRGAVAELPHGEQH